MIKIVQTYKTNDGKIHATELNARSHIIDSVCEFLDGKLNTACAIESRKEQLKAILALCGTIEKCQELRKILNDILDGDDDTKIEEDCRY